VKVLAAIEQIFNSIGSTRLQISIAVL